MLKTVQRFLLPEEDADEGAVEVSVDDAAEDRERIICRTCRCAVEPATIAGLEAHQELACPGRDEIFLEHMRRVAAAQPLEGALVGEAVQVGRHGPRARVVSVDAPSAVVATARAIDRVFEGCAERLFSPATNARVAEKLRRRFARASVRLEDGRTETLCLALAPASGDGDGAVPFRFLDDRETRELDACLKRADDRDAGRLSRAVVEARGLTERALAEKAKEAARGSKAEAEARKLTAEIDAIRLCDICVERRKDSACVPCGHLMCKRCATRCQSQGIGCPTCRRRIDSLLPIFS